MQASDYLQKRLDSGLSQSALARAMGYSRTHVIRVENGQVGASANYRDCFLAAVDGTDPDGIGKPRVTPAQARKQLGSAIPQLDAALEALDRNRAVFGKIKHVLGKSLDCVSAIADAETLPDADEFDPIAEGVDEDLDRVSEYIVEVLTDLLDGYNFYRFDEETLYKLGHSIADDAVRSVYMRQRNRLKRAGR